MGAGSFQKEQEWVAFDYQRGCMQVLNGEETEHKGHSLTSRQLEFNLLSFFLKCELLSNSNLVFIVGA